MISLQVKLWHGDRILTERIQKPLVETATIDNSLGIDYGAYVS